MAAQSKGKIVLNPGNRLASGLTAMTVLFGVADDLKKIRRVRACARVFVCVHACLCVCVSA